MLASQSMLFLTDEHISNAVVEFLRGRGHEVRRTRLVLGSSAPDQVIAAYGAPVRAIIVSKDRDFKPQKRKYPELGFIHVRCRDTLTLQRFMEYIDLIEFEYQRTLNVEGAQFYVTLNTEIFIVQR